LNFDVPEPAESDKVEPVQEQARPLSPPQDAPQVDDVPQSDEMDAAALVFLEDPIARRLAVAWVTCRGNEHEWLVAAGLPRLEASSQRIAAALRANQICRPGGVTDALALRYIRAVITKPIMAVAERANRGKDKR
jgi:hypothetical protein